MRVEMTPRRDKEKEELDAATAGDAKCVDFPETTNRSLLLWFFYAQSEKMKLMYKL